MYLIGMIVAQGDSATTHSFWADDKEQEYRMFEEFLAKIGRFEDFQVFCYGGYERAFLMRMRKQAKRKGPVDRVLKALFNTLSLIYSHIYFPTYSNGLKDIGGYLSCSWTEPDASGIQSIVWRKKWEATKGEEWKQRLTTYNMEDCAALKRVTELVCAVTDEARLASGQVQNGARIHLSLTYRISPGQQMRDNGQTSSFFIPITSTSTIAPTSTTRGIECMCGPASC